MKKHSILYFLSIVTLFMSSCSQMTYNKINTTLYQTRQQEIEKGALPYNPVIADLKVDLDKKVSGTAIRQITRYTDQEVEITKEASLYNATVNSGADLIVDPMFKINITNNDGKDDKITIQSDVSGFFGKYTSIHKADANELRMADYAGVVQVSQSAATIENKTTSVVIPEPTDQAAEAAKNKKRKRKIIGWTVGSILLLSAVGLGAGLGVSMASGL